MVIVELLLVPECDSLLALGFNQIEVVEVHQLTTNFSNSKDNISKKNLLIT
jgi:hypothetical protein